MVDRGALTANRFRQCSCLVSVAGRRMMWTVALLGSTTTATVVAMQVTACASSSDHNATDQVRAVRGDLGGFIVSGEQNKKRSGDGFSIRPEEVGSDCHRFGNYVPLMRVLGVHCVARASAMVRA